MFVKPPMTTSKIINGIELVLKWIPKIIFYKSFFSTNIKTDEQI